MANTQLIETPWLDILPPPAPLDNSLILILIITGLIASVLVALYVFWQGRPKQRALRQLKKLQSQFNTQDIDSKHSLFEINRLLCLGFQQQQLGRLAPVTHKHDWQAFYAVLVRQQYQAATPAKEETQRLLLAADKLLRSMKT